MAQGGLVGAYHPGAVLVEYGCLFVDGRVDEFARVVDVPPLVVGPVAHQRHVVVEERGVGVGAGKAQVVVAVDVEAGVAGESRHVVGFGEDIRFVSAALAEQKHKCRGQ